MRLLWLVAAMAGALSAQDNSELLNRITAMENRIKALEAEVQTLKARPAVPPAATPPAVAAQQPVPPEQPAVQGPVIAPQLGGAGAAAAKALNPDIAVIGDFLGAAGSG